MADRALLSRIDEHMARGNQLMARGNELMDRLMEEMDRFREREDRLVELHHDLRQFTREMLRRHELAMKEVSRDLRGLQAETRAGTKLLTDLHEESQAQRGAILQLVDELRRRGLGGRG